MRMRDPHIAILRAGEAGRGINLSADEVACLFEDDAIHGAANATLTEHELNAVAVRGWRAINPYPHRRSAST